MISDWIDEVTKVWGRMRDAKNKPIRSYRIFERAEMPDALSVYPCAISYLQRAQTVTIGTGGTTMIYKGVTEIHLAPSVSKANLPALMGLYDQVVRVVAANIQLGGRVEHFLLSEDDPIVSGVLAYGEEAPHLGLIIHWEVKERYALTVGA